MSRQMHNNLADLSLRSFKPHPRVATYPKVGLWLESLESLTEGEGIEKEEEKERLCALSSRTGSHGKS